MNDDLISRQSAIAILDRWLQCKDYSEGEVNIMRAMRYELENLPSVQQEPEHTMEEFMYGQDMGNPEDGSL